MGLGQDDGVVVRAGLDVVYDLLDAVAGVFEFSVERFVVIINDPAGTLTGTLESMPGSVQDCHGRGFAPVCP